MQTTSVHAPLIDDTIAYVGKSLGDRVANFGNSVSNAIADGTSTLGGNRSHNEEQQPTLPKKKRKKQKK